MVFKEQVLNLNILDFRYFFKLYKILKANFYILKLRKNYKVYIAMARATNHYTRSILRKVSFNPNLFCFEVQKAMQRLMPYEREELKDYISQQ